MFSRCITASLSLVLLIGCAPGAAPSAPTIQAGATQVAKEVQTGVAQVAPTAQAGATQVAKAVAPAVGTAVAAPPVRITDVGLSQTDATITLQNSGAETVDLSGWQVRVGDQAATLPAGARVAPGASVTLHTTSGTSTGTDLYLGTQAEALRGSLQRGARVALVDDRGSVVGEFVIP